MTLETGPRRARRRRAWLCATAALLVAGPSNTLAQAGRSRPSGARSGGGMMNGWIATIAFADDGDPLIFLPVRVNGASPGWWVLDSGASVCLIDRSVARHLALRTRGTRQIHGAGRGTVGIDSVRDTVRLGFSGGFATECDHMAAAETADTLLIDTGSGDAVDDSLVLHSTTQPRYETGAGRGLGKGYTAVAGTLDTVQLGRFSLAKVPAVAPGVALIGNAVWRRFVLILDYVHSRIFLEPNERLGSAFDRGPRSGVSFFASSYRSEPTVRAVEAGSPGAAAGIRAGDVIVELDGRPTGRFGVCRLARLLDRRGDVFRLGIRRGDEHLHVLLTP